MKEQNKTPEKELNKMEVANLSDAEFSTHDQDAQRTHWVWQQDTGRSEDYAKWNKEKSTGNQQWREGSQIQIKDLKHKEEINIQPEQNEETTTLENENKKTLGLLQTCQH